MPPVSIADLLPQVRGILPLTDIDALNRLARTLCDVVETTLAVSPPTPTNEAVAVPALTPRVFILGTAGRAAAGDGYRAHGARAAWVAAEGAVQGPSGAKRKSDAPRLRAGRTLDLEVAGRHD